MNFDDIEKLKQIPIMDIVNRLGIKVLKNKAMCFNGHDHKTPSLSFSPNKNLWHCFGCGLGGNNISLVKEYYGYTFKEAVAWLMGQFNLSSSLNFRERFPLPKTKVDTGKIISDSMKHSVPDYEVYGAFISKCSLSEKGEKYLQNRGYSIKTINYFKIKDIVNITETEKCLLNNFERNRLLNSGLMVMRRENLRLIWWDHTILFPFIKQNRIVYIQGRRLLSDSPKYIGLFGISKPLYNRDVLVKLSKNSTVFICEGITDTLTASQFCFNAVGVLGALSFRKEWVNELNKFRIIVVPDSDSAGKIFEKKIREAFLEKGHIIEVIRINRGKDLSDLLKGIKDVSHK